MDIAATVDFESEISQRVYLIRYSRIKYCSIIIQEYTDLNNRKKLNTKINHTVNLPLSEIAVITLCR